MRRSLANFNAAGRALPVLWNGKALESLRLKGGNGAVPSSAPGDKTGESVPRTPQIPDGDENEPAPQREGELPAEKQADSEACAPVPAEPEAQAEAQEESWIVTNDPQLGWAKADAAQ